LGDGTQTNSPTPVQVVGVQQVVNVAGGNGFSLATVATPGFAIALNAASGSIARGGSVTTQVALMPVNGFAGSASLAASGLPAGVTASFSPNSVSAGNPATLTLHTSAKSPVGTFAITVTAVENAASGRVKTAVYQLTIVKARSKG
jgi:hypothetical protein